MGLKNPCLLRFFFLTSAAFLPAFFARARFAIRAGLNP